MITIKEINQQLIEIEEIKNTRKIIERKKSDVDSELQRKKREAKLLALKLSKERSDVEALQTQSFKRFFASVIGKLDEKLSVEQNELMDVKLKFDELHEEIDFLKRELSGFKSELNGLKHIDNDYDYLIDKKTTILRENNPEFKKEMDDYVKNISLSKEQLIEITQAIRVGSNSRSSLNQALIKLRKADNLARWDYHTDSLLLTMTKHNRAEEANRLITRARSQIKRFKKECGDVNFEFHVSTVYMTEYSKTSDMLFNNLFTNWGFRSSLESTISTVTHSLNEIGVVMNKLRDLEYKHNSIIESSEHKLDKMIENG